MSIIITYVDLGRLLTDEELVLRNSALDSAVAAGTTNGTNALAETRDPGIRIWTTEAAANEWVALFNSFTPAPVKTLVETI